MQYEILIDNKLYKTITADGGYNLNQIMEQLHNDEVAGKLTGFDLSKGVTVKPV